MSTTTLLFLVGALAGDPEPAEAKQSQAQQVQPRANHQVIQRDGTTSWRFYDNQWRRVADDARREQAARREAVVRQRFMDDRMQLADRLDRLIGAGDCAGARQTAGEAGYIDIAGAVDRTCLAKGL